MKKFLSLIAVIAVCLFVSACGGKSPEQMMVGKFKITDITTDQNLNDNDRAAVQQFMEELKQNSSYEHKSDHSLILIINGLEQHGTWELLGDDLQLQYCLEGQSVIKQEIKELTDSYFVLTTRDEIGTTTVTTYTKE